LAAWKRKRSATDEQRCWAAPERFQLHSFRSLIVVVAETPPALARVLGSGQKQPVVDGLASREAVFVQQVRKLCSGRQRRRGIIQDLPSAREIHEDCCNNVEASIFAVATLKTFKKKLKTFMFYKHLGD